MTKFNPEDFRAPEMEPLSTVTIFDETIEWDKTAKGVVAVYGDGVVHIVDGNAYYEQARGEYGEGSVRVDLTIDNNNIDTNVLACSIAAKQLMYKELVEECGGDEMKAMHIQLKRFAADKDLTIVTKPRSVFMDNFNPERVQMMGSHMMQKPNPDIVLSELHSEASKALLTQPKAQPYGSLVLREPKMRVATHKGLSVDVKSGMMGMLDERNPAGKITEIDPDMFSKPMTGGFAEDCADHPVTMHYYRECSCKSCGAPISFYAASVEEYCKARFKGQSPNNFTDDELERHYGVVGEIDGVIYDDARLCSSCKAYDY